MKTVGKWIKDLFLRELDDVNISSESSNDILFYNPSTSNWENGNTANVDLLSANELTGDMEVPQGTTAFKASFKVKQNRVKIKGRLKVK